ncbi:hypothetical protein ACKUZF_002230 [Proteus mirabilis]
MYEKNIRLTNLDAIQFIDNNISKIEGKAFINIDPPYYVKGKGLYQNYFEHDDHYRLFESVKRIKHPWIVTYDDTPEICSIYSEYLPKSFGLSYTAQKKYIGSEVIIHSPSLIKSKFQPGITFNQIKNKL